MTRMTDASLPPHTRRSAETWAAVRADYEAGASTPVIGERYGLDPRSVRRRAAREAWQRADPAPRRFDPLRARIEADMERLPELAEVCDIKEEDRRNLLLLPDARALCRYAFRRAAESAALDGPAESAAWLRVVRLAVAVGSRIDADVRPFGPGDYLRASMIAAIMAEREVAADGELGTESDMSAESAENDGGPDSSD